MLTLFRASALLLACLTVAAGPPPAKTVDYTEALFGMTVKDPYHWMEAGGTVFDEWLTAEGSYARSSLDAIPGRTHLLSEIRRLDNAESRVDGAALAGRGLVYGIVRPEELIQQDFCAASCEGRRPHLDRPERVQCRRRRRPKSTIGVFRPMGNTSHMEYRSEVVKPEHCEFDASALEATSRRRLIARDMPGQAGSITHPSCTRAYQHPLRENRSVSLVDSCFYIVWVMTRVPMSLCLTTIASLAWMHPHHSSSMDWRIQTVPRSLASMMLASAVDRRQST